MDFALTGEQEALRDTAAKYLADERADADRAWNDVTGLGWIDPELGTVELALLAEQLGYARSPSPWWATVGLAGPALRAGGRTLRRPATLAWAEEPGPGTLAALLSPARSGGVSCTVAADGTLDGRKVAVPHAGEAADLVVAVAGPDGVELRLVDASALHPAPSDAGPAGLDPTRPAATVDLSGAASAPLVAAHASGDVLAEIRRRTLTLLAAEAVGVATRALAWATEYATARTQFGRPIGANQAVAHPLAELYGQVETARSLAYRAAWSVDAEPGPVADRAVATAAVAGREAATTACEAAIQTYGGSGFTWEQPLHHWYRRAWWLATFDGTVSDLRAELAASLLDGTTGQDAPGR
ncbi:acyl-CoA dehydrogenase family protein [Micromonospora sp. WMMC241]|uniref:acyl-CoA dehydrogenase family protein n=1 Tax=Micromonospora sp. WMMC241 TaxID=3015159 RepID=UPI0022B71EB7|nr:acyl-CoA dehydrogenase family protein [Micromonospora sp. WMMC241]MCZ7437585.1 acyl-CoA dehydrogenase family protein [Micromonospora sp. WMMC241]